MNRNLWIVLAICALPRLHAQEMQIPTEHHARDRTYHVLHYALEIAIDEKQKTCVGSVSITLVPLRPRLDTVRLDAAEMKISDVRLGNRSVGFRSVGESLFVDLGKPYGLLDTLNLSVSYEVSSPRKGLYFITPDSGYPGKRLQVWSQGEAEDNHFWFPCYDYPNDKSTSEMTVTVNDRWTAISNGRLADVSRDPAHHRATFHWVENQPHVSYLISLVAGEYVDVKDAWGNVPISNYVYPEQEKDAMRSFGKTPEMIDFYSTRIGYPYPWEKYAQTVVEDFIYGGEENVTATTLTDATIHDARAHLDYSSDGLVAHELAHMWWGDMLTCRDWSHAWLNEGFATYFENLYEEHDRGADFAAKEIYDNQVSLRNLDVGDRRRPTVCGRYVSPMDLFDAHIYGKGAVVLNMLRFVLGDELFWKSIHAYAEKFAFQCVETNDFKVAVEDATGYNLRWFFDEWLYKAGYPEFDVATAWDEKTRMLRMTVKQVQTIDSLTGYFRMPVDVEVWLHGEPQTYRVWVDGPQSEFSFPAYQEPQLMIFDKGSKILKKVNVHKRAAEWIYQLQHASDGVDRIQALDELQWLVDSTAAGDAIAKAAIEDPFDAVRREAVWTLGDARKRDYSSVLLTAYGDRDARVRAAAVTSLGGCKGENVLAVLQHAFDKDSSYSVEAAALRSLAKVDSARRKTYCSEGLAKDSHNEIIRSTALQVLAAIGDEEAVKAVMAYTRYGVERNLRIQCVETLARTWKSRDDVLAHLLRMLNDPSFHVRRAVIAALGGMGRKEAINALKKSAENEADSRLAKEARDAIDRIEGELQKPSH